MNRRLRATSGVQLDMTPMIDVVFQLLAFFLMTFRVAAAEGDFRLDAPLTNGSRCFEVASPVLLVRLAATPEGALSGISLNGEPMENFAALHCRVREIVGDDRGPGSFACEAEVEFECDSILAYRHVIDAVTAVSGERAADGRVLSLVEKIRFAPSK